VYAGGAGQGVSEREDEWRIRQEHTRENLLRRGSHTPNPTPQTMNRRIPGRTWRLCQYRCRMNMAHLRQSRPDSGVGFQEKIFKPFQVVPSSLGSGVRRDWAHCRMLLTNIQNSYTYIYDDTYMATHIWRHIYGDTYTATQTSY
jgi:hypothetical protein